MKKIKSLFEEEDLEGSDAESDEPAGEEESSLKVGDEAPAPVNGEEGEEGPTTAELEDELSEAYVKIYKLGKKLQENNRNLKRISKEINESALLNAKLSYVNKIMAVNKNLSNTAKMSVIESIDEANTVREVQLVYNSIQKNFLAERKNQRSKQRLTKEVTSLTRRNSKRRSKKTVNESLKNRIKRRLNENNRSPKALTKSNRKRKLVNENVNSFNKRKGRRGNVDQMRKKAMSINENYKPAYSLSNQAFVDKFQKLAKLK